MVNERDNNDVADRVNDTETEKLWHALEVEEVFSELESSRHGISSAEVERRLEQVGPNEVETEGRATWAELLWAQLKNPLVLVLVAAALISLAAGETTDAIVILVVIVFNTLIGFIQEYQAEGALEALRSQAAPEAEVLRCLGPDGECEEMTVKAGQVVPGDVLLLATGDKVPADARLFEAHSLEVDEAMLTGESLPVAKITDPMDAELATAERRNLVYGGTAVTQGRGKAVVYATGERTQMGQIATLIRETEKVETPLQRQSKDLGKKLGFFAVGVSILTVVLGFVQGFDLQEVFLFALAVAVSAIPEGLPAVMTITLAIGVSRMAKRNAIIRRLQAVDTLGAATVICSDKTGTLTTNQMTVQRIYVSGRRIDVTGAGFEPQGQFLEDGEELVAKEDTALRRALRIITLANDAHLTHHYLDSGDSRWEIRGDPTEGGLVVAAAKAGMQREEMEEARPRIDEIPFSSEAKFMATFHELSNGEDVRVYLKGAPEVVLGFCTHQLEGEGVRRSTEEDVEEYERINEEMAGDALRVLGLAFATIKRDEIEDFKEDIRRKRAEMVFGGLVGMMDPPRPEVGEAVSRARNAGIRVVMATGDHRITGEAIARQVGILESGGTVYTGTEVEEMTDEELDAKIQDARVFARVSPTHKHRIVESLRRHREVVAMTGDGVNDAPALKASDIGVAMGITGTDVTKETADMVLTDDNFASIVNAVEEGRVVFQNVRKVVKFLIATNFGEIVTILTSLLLFTGGKLIFNPVQILWVNLVTDGLLDITIAMEPKEGDVMHEPPRRPDARIINREMLRNTVFVALFMAVGTLWMFARSNYTVNLVRAQTIAFTTLAMFQVFNALNVRSRDKSLFEIGPFSNRYLLGAIVVSLILQVLATTVPFMQTALGTEALKVNDWLLITAVAGSVFVADEARKFLRRHLKRGG